MILSPNRLCFGHYLRQTGCGVKKYVSLGSNGRKLHKAEGLTVQTLRVIAAALMVAALTFTASQSSFATAPSPDSTFVVGDWAEAETPSKVELEDLRDVADSLGISVEAAIAKFSGQELFAAAVDEIRAQHAQAFATALWIGGNEIPASIAFAGAPDPRALDRVAALPFPVEVRVDAFASEIDLIAAQIAARDAVGSTPGIDLAESEIDTTTGSISVIYSLGSTLTKAEVVAIVEAAIRIKLGTPLPKGAVSVRAGIVNKPTETAIVGGNSLGGCTAAFAITSGGVPGIATAAHCANGNYSYGGSTATYKAQSSPSSGDVQWHQVGAAVTNKFRYTPSGGERSVTSTSNPTSGSAICYLGKTTGNNCGTVSTINYCDSAGYCLLFRSGPSRVDLGDSGGPWYFGNVAKGVTRGFLTSGGARVDDIATRVGALNLLNTVVKTAP